MGKLKIVLLAVGLAVFIILAVLFVVGYFKPQKAGIIIETSPSSMVYINGEQVGRSRYEATRSPGEVTVKLVPESKDTPLMPYETKVSLVSGVKTIIQRNFANTKEASSGIIVSFEKSVDDETSISVVSTPDSAQVTIDGQVRGFAPFKSSQITEGEHNLTLEATDYESKSIDIKTYKGYKLTAIFDLVVTSRVDEPISSLAPTASPDPEEEFVEILETPTGFLRVRSEPSTLASEVGQVEPGKKYKLIDTDEKTGWYKIELQSKQGVSDAESGWVTNQYAEKISAESPSPTPTNTVATPRQ